MSRFVGALLTLIAAVGASVVLVAPTSAMAASSVPWTDPAQHGYIGFCDSSNHQVTTGSIDTAPFAIRAVSSSPAPSGYGLPTGHATLYVYQPIQNEDPGNWSGKQMTGSSAFSNPKAPMAIGTIGDPSLVNFSAVFPPYWDHLVQFRIYYTNIGAVQYSDAYPAAAVQITGKTWKQLGGGKVNCTAGRASSDEQPLVDRLQSSLAAHPNQHPSTSPASTTGSKTTTTPSGDSASGSQNAGAPSATSASRKSSSSAGLITLIIVLVLAAGGSLGYVLIRRRNRTT